jgi:hypothetical protein
MWPVKHQQYVHGVGSSDRTSFSITRIHSVRPKSILWMSFGVGMRVPLSGPAKALQVTVLAALTLSWERPHGITELLRIVSVTGPAMSPFAAATWSGVSVQACVPGLLGCSSQC